MSSNTGPIFQSAIAQGLAAFDSGRHATAIGNFLAELARHPDTLHVATAPRVRAQLSHVMYDRAAFEAALWEIAADPPPRPTTDAP